MNKDSFPPHSRRSGEKGSQSVWTHWGVRLAVAMVFFALAIYVAVQFLGAKS